jgi:hypothetical protein
MRLHALLALVCACTHFDYLLFLYNTHERLAPDIGSVSRRYPADHAEEEALHGVIDAYKWP